MISNLVQVIFSKKYSNRAFNIHKNKAEWTKRYSDFTYIQGKQSIPNLKTRSSWRGFQLKEFLHVLLIPTCINFLPNTFLEDLRDLRQGILLLSQSSISKEDISESRQCLVRFYVNLSRNWGVDLCSINDHNSIHLPDCAVEAGPLFGISGFISEKGVGEFVESMYNFFVQLVNFYSCFKWYKRKCCYSKLYGSFRIYKTRHATNYKIIRFSY